MANRTAANVVARSRVAKTRAAQDGAANGAAKILEQGITFDDVLLLPRLSGVVPADVSVKTKLTRHIDLNIPLIAAAMDTVTKSEMAIAIAREGGIGVIHKNMPIDRQAAEVDRVKRSESGMILNPITLGPDRPLREATQLMARFHISGVPIVGATTSTEPNHMERRETLELVRAYYRIDDQIVRRRVFDLVKSLGGLRRDAVSEKNGEPA